MPESRALPLVLLPVLQVVVRRPRQRPPAWTNWCNGSPTTLPASSSSTGPGTSLVPKAPRRANAAACHPRLSAAAALPRARPGFRITVTGELVVVQVRQCRADALGRGLEQEYCGCRQQGRHQGQGTACVQWKWERDYPEYSHYATRPGTRLIKQNLNPQYVWGGDAITLDDADMVWIDHNKISLIGRQFIATGWGKAGHVTISNNEFDGQTPWSASCNGEHYWTLLLLGEQDYYTFEGNWLHDVSGRAPHMGTDHTSSQIFFHGVNNYFQDLGGHAFDVGANTWVLLEGNYFANVNTPLTEPSLMAGGKLYTTSTVSAAGDYLDQLEYICEWNRLMGSGAWQDRTDADVKTKAATYKNSLVGHYAVADVPAKVVANAGVGKL